MRKDGGGVFAVGWARVFNDSFAMIPLRSSAIRAAGYDPLSRRLLIRFTRGGSFTFYRVPESIFHGLVRAGSPGRFYNTHIRGRFGP